MARKLEQLALTEGGRLDMAGGVYLLTLEGNRRELGTRHAELTRYISADVTARYYRGLLSRVIRNALNGPTAGLRAELASGVLYRLFGIRNRKSLVGGLLEETEALLAGLRCPGRMARKLLIFPDILHYLAGKMAAPSQGCSACFVAPALSGSGGALLGRNFDFFGVGVWDEYQAVQRIFPAAGLAHFWVGPLGIPVGGFGMNAAGIAVMPFSLFTRDCGTSGVPMFVVMDRILHEADSLAAVEKIIRESGMTGSFSLLVADMGSGDARVFGLGKRHTEVRSPVKGLLLRTNHQQSETGQARERIPAGWARHSRSRLERMEEYFRSSKKKATLESVIALLGDRWDAAEGREALVGGILPAVNNALSVVVDAGKDQLAVGRGLYPVAAQGVYELFSLKELFKKKDAWKGEYTVPRKSKISDREAVQCYNSAWQAWFERGDRQRAIRLLHDAGALAPGEPAFPRMSGLLQLKGGDWERAILDLERAFGLEPRVRKPEAGLWLARALDCAGRRRQAVDRYDAVASLDKESAVGRAAATGAQRPWTRRQSHNIKIEFVTATAE